MLVGKFMAHAGFAFARAFAHSFEAQCVLPPGTRAPPDPGPGESPHRATLYGRIGGVYPIAHFVDVLVDKALAVGSNVTLHELDDVNEPEARRHPPGLKYLLTEVRSHATPCATASPPCHQLRIRISVSQQHIVAIHTYSRTPTPHYPSRAGSCSAMPQVAPRSSRAAGWTRPN